MWINTTHGDAWTVLAQVPISSQPQFQDSQLDHRLFDKKKGVRDGNKTAAKHYDSYEQGNQRDAIKFFTNSITQMLKLNLFQICQDRNIKNYPGEGVELLSADYHNRSTFLHEAALVVSAMIVCRSDVFHHIFFRILPPAVQPLLRILQVSLIFSPHFLACATKTNNILFALCFLIAPSNTVLVLTSTSYDFVRELKSHIEVW